jgi:hypothetical protein
VGKSIYIDRPGNRRKSSHQIPSLGCALHLAWLASKTLDVVIEVLPKVSKDWHSDLSKVHFSTYTSPPTNLYTSTQRLPCEPTLFNNLSHLLDSSAPSSLRGAHRPTPRVTT